MLFQPPLSHTYQIAFSYPGADYETLKSEVAGYLASRFEAHSLLTEVPSARWILRNDDYAGTPPSEYFDRYEDTLLIVLFLGGQYFGNSGTMQEWKRIVGLDERLRHRVLPVYMEPGNLQAALERVYPWFCGGCRAWQWEANRGSRIADEIFRVWEALAESWAAKDFCFLRLEDEDGSAAAEAQAILERNRYSWRAIPFPDPDLKPRSLPQEAFCRVGASRVPPVIRESCAGFARRLATRGFVSTLLPLWVTSDVPSAPPGWMPIAVGGLADCIERVASLKIVNVVCDADLQKQLVERFGRKTGAELRFPLVNLRVWSLAHLDDGPHRNGVSGFPFFSLYERAAVDRAHANFVALSPGLARDARALADDKTGVGRVTAAAILDWFVRDDARPWTVVDGMPLSRDDRLALSPLPLALEPSAMNIVDAIAALKEEQY